MGVCINLAGLISSIWAWELMHLLRLLAAMSPVDTGWTRPIISLAVSENTAVANNPTTTITTTTTTKTNHSIGITKPPDLLLTSMEFADVCLVETGSV